MSETIGKFTKTIWERKRRTIDYTDYFSGGTDSIQSISFSSTPADANPAVVDAQSVTSPTVTVFISGGILNTDYEIDVEMVTVQGEKKEGVIKVSVRP